MHLCAFLLVALAMALIMTPAAYHRQAERGVITASFIRLASMLICASMAPLAVGLSLDTFLIARLVSHDQTLSIATSVVLLATFIGLWFVFPALRRPRRRPEWTSRRTGETT